MGERSTSLFRYPQHSIAMPFTSPTSLAPNPNRSPKRESQCDIVKVEPGVCGPEVLRSTNTNIGVLTYLNSSDCIGVVGYPTTPKMDIEIPPEAAAATTNEKRTPFGYIPIEDQVQFIPVINGVIAVPNTEQEKEDQQEKREDIKVAYEKALANLKESPHNSVYLDDVAACGKDLIALTENFKQYSLTPEKVEVKVDVCLGIIEVSVTYDNTTGKCGEVAVSLGATNGLTYLSATTAVADYPHAVECMLKNDALKSYKALNQSANRGAAISENGRMAHATRFKLPAGDTSVTTFRLKVADLEAHWKEQPMAESHASAGLHRSMEYTIFTPPGEGNNTYPFSIVVQPPEDESITFDLASSQAAEHEANVRSMPLFYLDPKSFIRGYTFGAPMQPLCLKVRVNHTNDWDTLHDLKLGQMTINTRPIVKVLSHAHCGHSNVKNSAKDDCLAVVELEMPLALTAPARTVPKKLNFVLVADASGSMYCVAPAGSGMNNLQKLGKEIAAVGKKLLGLVPYLREHGLSILGDKVIFHCIRFHSSARFVSSPVDLTGPNAEAGVAAMVKDFENAKDSGGTSYCSWLDLVQQLAIEDCPLVVWLGTDGGAHDGSSFFPRLESIKKSKPKMAVVVVAMGAWLDESCAARTQTDGHRLMQEVGFGFTDYGYQMAFKAIVKMLQDLSITIDGPVLAVSGHTEMPALGADGKTAHNLCLGTKVRYALCGKYCEDGRGRAIRLPGFQLDDGTAIHIQAHIGHLVENSDAVLSMVDETYCAPSVAIVADANEAHKRAVTGLAFHYKRDTMYTACRTLYIYNDDKAKLAPDVKAKLPADVVCKGVVAAHEKANVPWMFIAHQSRRPTFVHAQPESEPVFRSAALEEEPKYCSLGCSDDQPRLRSLPCDGPVLPSLAKPPAKPSAKMNIHTEAVTTASAYLAHRNHAYELSINENGLEKVFQQLDKHLQYLLNKSRDGAPAIGPNDMLTDDKLEKMADQQGDECDDQLSAVVSELSGLVGVLVHLAFLTHFAGGVCIMNAPFTDPTNVHVVILRVKYLRSIALRMAGMEEGASPLYRPVLTFEGFVESTYHTNFKASLKFVKTPVMQRAQDGIVADYVVGCVEEAVYDACKLFCKGWNDPLPFSSLQSATVPTPALVQLSTPIAGFDNEIIKIPPPHYKLDEEYFHKMADKMTEQVVALCIKKNGA